MELVSHPYYIIIASIFAKQSRDYAFANAKHADDPIYARDGLVIRTWRHIAKQSSLFRPTNRVGNFKELRSCAVTYTWMEFLRLEVVE